MKQKQTVANKIKSFLAAGLIVALLAPGFTVPVYASPQSIQITGSTVNVRSNAGTSNSVVGKARKGEQYTYLAQKTDTKGQLWYQILLSNNQKGWVSGAYANPIGSTNDQKVTITGRSVNIRAGAGTSYNRVASVTRGSTYQYLGSASDAKGTVWYHIQYNNRQTAWVSSQYSQLVATPTTTSATASTSVPTSAATAASATTTTSAQEAASQLKITSHPADVTTKSGKLVSFAVKAAGTGLKYQWYYKKQGQTAWSEWRGHTTAATTASANDSWNGMKVYCRVTDASGRSVNSSAATVTISKTTGTSAKLKITSHPADVSVASGTPVVFAVKAEGVGLQYQWHYKRPGSTGWTKWNGKTTPSITVTSSSNWNGMQVRCQITDAGGQTLYSNASTVTILKMVSSSTKSTTATTATTKTATTTSTTATTSTTSAKTTAPAVTTVKQVVITGKSVNIRSGPGTSYNRVASVVKGSTYPYIETKLDAKKNRWHKIQYTKTQTAWVIATYSQVTTVTIPATTASTTAAQPAKTTQATQTTQPAASSSGQYVATEDATNVRSKAGKSYGKIGMTTPGQKYRYLGKATDSNGNIWYHIQYSASKTGWVARAYCRLYDTADAITVSSKKKIAYLTFDDGPSVNTMKILDILDQYNVKATFFVIYHRNMESQYKAIVQRGHTIALHSYTHNYDQIYASETAYFNDLTQIHDYVKSVTGVDSHIIRFPGGSSNGAKKIMTKLKVDVIDRGYIYHDWNVDSTDAQGSNRKTDVLLDAMKKGVVKYNKADILMHDSGVSKNTTVQALPKLIEYLRSQGYAIEPITQDTLPIQHIR